MSNNKTVIPGIPNSSTDWSPNSQGGVPNALGGKYSGNGTVIVDNYGYQGSAAPRVLNAKPIVGFLYSISRTGNGEYWPLHVGPNSIGRSASSDIYLPEATVSEQHAEFVVRLMKNPEKLIASIYDQRSTCGTMVNGESLGFEPRECANGDIITIGEHYDLYVILIDVKALGLNICQGFIPTQTSDTPSAPSVGTSDDGRTKFYEAPYSPQGMPQPEPPIFQPGRTVNASGNPRTEPGKTIFMK